MSSLWPLQHDNKFMFMAVHVQPPYGDLFFMTVALYFTAVGGPKIKDIAKISGVTLSASDCFVCYHPCTGNFFIFFILFSTGLSPEKG